jgi:estrone sulfotransferase
MPRTLKQYYRAVLVKLGLFDETTFRLALDTIYPDDVFLVSYPKSGNTWLRYLIAHALHPGAAIDSTTIDQFVPDVYVAWQKTNVLPRPRFIKTHDTWFEGFPKTVYIVRDYRDVLISFYHYQRALGKFSGTISEFISAIDQPHPFGSWKEHVTKALKFRAHHPERMLMIRYEDLHRQPRQILSEVLTFSGVKWTVDLDTAIEASSFSSLQRMEKMKGSELMDKTGSSFFREGKSGTWNSVLSERDLERILHEQGHLTLLKQLNYL